MSTIQSIYQCLTTRPTKASTSIQLHPSLAWYAFGLFLKKILSMNVDDVEDRESILEVIQCIIRHSKRFSLRAVCFPEALWNQCLKIFSSETVVDMDRPRDLMLLIWFRLWAVFLTRLHLHSSLVSMEDSIPYMFPSYDTFLLVVDEWDRVLRSVAETQKGAILTCSSSTSSSPTLTSSNRSNKSVLGQKRARGSSTAHDSTDHGTVEWDDMYALEQLKTYQTPEMETMFSQEKKPAFPGEEQVTVVLPSVLVVSTASSSSTSSTSSSTSSSSSSTSSSSSSSSSILSDGSSGDFLRRWNHYRLYAQYVGLVAKSSSIPCFIQCVETASTFLSECETWLQQVSTPASKANRLPSSALDYVLLSGMYGTVMKNNGIEEQAERVLGLLQSKPYVLDPTSASIGYVIHAFLQASTTPSGGCHCLKWVDWAITFLSICSVAKDHQTMVISKSESILSFIFRSHKASFMDAFLRLFYCRKQWEEWIKRLKLRLDVEQKSYEPPTSTDQRSQIFAQMCLDHETEWSEFAVSKWSSRKEYHFIRVLKGSIHPLSASKQTYRVTCVDELNLRQSQTSVSRDLLEQLVRHTQALSNYLSPSVQTIIFPEGIPSMDWFPPFPVKS